MTDLRIPWQGRIAIEGKPSADGRLIDPLALTWYSPDDTGPSEPWPLMLVTAGTMTPVGTVTSIWRVQPGPTRDVYGIYGRGWVDLAYWPDDIDRPHRFAPWGCGIDAADIAWGNDEDDAGPLRLSAGRIIGVSTGPDYTPAMDGCQITFGDVVETAPNPDPPLPLEAPMTIAPEFELAAAGRSPDVQEFVGLFDYAHLPDQLARVSAIFHDAAVQVLAEVGDGVQLTFALQSLLVAKDAAVRQARRDLDARQAVHEAWPPTDGDAGVARPEPGHQNASVFTADDWEDVPGAARGPLEALLHQYPGPLGDADNIAELADFLHGAGLRAPDPESADGYTPLVLRGPSELGDAARVAPPQVLVVPRRDGEDGAAHAARTQSLVGRLGEVVPPPGGWLVVPDRPFDGVTVDPESDEARYGGDPLGDEDELIAAVAAAAARPGRVERSPAENAGRPPSGATPVIGGAAGFLRVSPPRPDGLREIDVRVTIAREPGEDDRAYADRVHHIGELVADEALTPFLAPTPGVGPLIARHVRQAAQRGRPGSQAGAETPPADDTGLRPVTDSDLPPGVRTVGPPADGSLFVADQLGEEDASTDTPGTPSLLTVGGPFDRSWTAETGAAHPFVYSETTSDGVRTLVVRVVAAGLTGDQVDRLVDAVRAGRVVPSLTAPPSRIEMPAPPAAPNWPPPTDEERASAEAAGLRIVGREADGSPLAVPIDDDEPAPTPAGHERTRLAPHYRADGALVVPEADGSTTVHDESELVPDEVAAYMDQGMSRERAERVAGLDAEQAERVARLDADEAEAEADDADEDAGGPYITLDDGTLAEFEPAPADEDDSPDAPKG